MFLHFYLLFVGFGIFAVPIEIISSWTGQDPNIVFTFNVFNQNAYVTSELFRISGFVAALSGLYFVVSSLTDEKYRKEFIEELLEEVKIACAVRIAYFESLEVKDSK